MRFTPILVASIVLCSVAQASLVPHETVAAKTKTVAPSLQAMAFQQTSYDPNIAMHGWFFSKSTFCNRTEIASWTCPVCNSVPGMVDVVVSHNTTTGGQGFVGYYPSSSTIVMAFRGSDDTINWINDLDFFFIDYANPDCAVFNGGTQNSSICQVHRGFLNVYVSIRDPLLAQIRFLMTKYSGTVPNVSILVTGHSLGAALTILAAADVSLEFKSATQGRIAVYSFGEPRVGNPAWAKWMSESVLVGGKQYRVTHEADPVPRLPPLEFGFLHVPHEVWYNNDLAGNNYTLCIDNATAEDYTNCENTQYAFVVDDHLLYMGIHAGCAYVPN